MRVIQERAVEKGTSVEVVEMNQTIKDTRIGLAGEFQYQNAALAVALVSNYIHKTSGEALDGEMAKKGLESVQWAGRCQEVSHQGVHYFIDGAHTLDSLSLAVRWFAELKPSNVKCGLIFNQQTRDAAAMLKLLTSLLLSRNVGVDCAVFTLNHAFSGNGESPDLTNKTLDESAVQHLSVQQNLAKVWKDNTGSPGHAVASVEKAIEIFNEQGITCVLVTGSLHLVGAFLAFIEGQKS
jgi:folylpolyglutamate synthase